MEELRKTIATAVEEGVKRGLENANFAIGGKDPNELLTAEQIAKEENIPVNNVRKLFNNPDMAVQTYIKPRKVTRKAWNEFISKRR